MIEKEDRKAIEDLERYFKDVDLPELEETPIESNTEPQVNEISSLGDLASLMGKNQEDLPTKEATQEDVMQQILESLQQANSYLESMSRAISG